jgi:hypothetical protein
MFFRSIFSAVLSKLFVTLALFIFQRISMSENGKKRSDYPEAAHVGRFSNGL